MRGLGPRTSVARSALFVRFWFDWLDETRLVVSHAVRDSVTVWAVDGSTAPMTLRAPGGSQPEKPCAPAVALDPRATRMAVTLADCGIAVYDARASERHLPHRCGVEGARAGIARPSRTGELQCVVESCSVRYRGVVPVTRATPPWPYPEPTLPAMPDGKPTWARPDHLCTCQDANPPVGRTYRLVFFDHRGLRTPGARCRIHFQGRLLVTAPASAEGDASVVFDAGHYILHPDYGETNSGGKQNGRQAHFNHIHAQLGPTDPI